MGVLNRGSTGRARRRRGPQAIQEALFDIEVRPERRYFKQMLDLFGTLGFGTDALASERIVSGVFGTVWAGQEAPRDGSVDEAFGLGLVDYVRHRRVPASVAVLRTVARIAPIREVRAAAGAGAAALVSDGLPEPRWSPPLDALVPGLCWALEDIFGDESTIMCEFRYGDTEPALRHALLVCVDHAMFSAASDAVVTVDVDELTRDMRNDTHGPDAAFTFRQVEPSWARALLERAFARTDLIEGVHTEAGFASVRALAMARTAALPDDPSSLPAEPLPPSPTQRTAIVAEFLASSPLPRSSAVESAAERILSHGSEYDPGRLLRVSPGKWETFAFDWLPRQALPPDEQKVIPDVVRNWTQWASRPLPEQARAELATAVEEILNEAPAFRSP